MADSSAVPEEAAQTAQDTLPVSGSRRGPHLKTLRPWVWSRKGDSLFLDQCPHRLRTERSIQMKMQFNQMFFVHLIISTLLLSGCRLHLFFPLIPFPHGTENSICNYDDQIGHQLDKLQRHAGRLQIIGQTLTESEEQGGQHSHHRISGGNCLCSQCDISSSCCHSGRRTDLHIPWTGRRRPYRLKYR